MKTKQPPTVDSSTAMRVAASGEEAVTGDVRNEMLKNIHAGIEKCIEDTPWEEPYYVVVLARRQHSMKNVMKTTVISRRTEPIKDFDMCCYIYDPVKEVIDLKWAVPTREGVAHYASLPSSCAPSMLPLRQFCIDFLDEKEKERASIPSC